MVKKIGGWKNVPNEGVMDDLLGFYNHYLEKAIKGTDVQATSVPSGSGVSNSLIIIDMQNDFTLPNGAFSVADGMLLMDPLVAFMDANMDKFSKIVFSRDIHDVNHCSFMSRNGPFPPHCVINSMGAALMPNFKKYEGMDKVEVIFKGMHPNVDSFGAYQYPNDAYSAGRQIGPECCTDKTADGLGSCSDMTGGKYLLDKSKAFADIPFTPAAANTYEAIKGQLGAAFSVGDLIPEGSTEHNVFVVGLAGDFCCKDTAMNIAKTVAMDPSVAKGAKVNVYIIEPFVRYAFLPIAFAPPFVDKAMFKSVQEGKDFSYYMFEVLPGDKKRILKTEELTADLNVDDMKYSHFLTDPKTIVADYAAAGVKILMDAPVLGMSGGRRNRRKTQRNRRNRKATRKARKIYRK